MNELVKELAEKAGFSFDFSPSDDETDREYQVVSNDFAKNFSELIVQECANIILEYKSEPFPLDPDFAAKMVKEHFGIK